MRFLVCLVLAMMAARDAAACPPGPCLKYRRMQPVEPIVQEYRRSVRGLPPRGRARLVRFLTDATWLPSGPIPAGPGMLPPRTLRFVDATRAQRAPTMDRVVLIREIERRNRTLYVAVDGDYFALARCGAATCLQRVGALPEEEVEIEPEHRFATPPP